MGKISIDVFFELFSRYSNFDRDKNGVIALLTLSVNQMLGIGVVYHH